MIGQTASAPGLTASAPGLTASAPQRVLALDGFRGLMTLMVVLSHYFTEVQHPLPGLNGGWIAVKMFFVLSGFLVGRLMLEKMDRANFFAVFFIRRACRTIPLFGFWTIVIAIALYCVGPVDWAQIDDRFPLWSYFTFTQNFFMVGYGSMGTHWLAPTWTLTVEEHFYLLAPAIFFFTPRRYLLPTLIAGALMSVAFRAFAFGNPDIPSLTSAVMLPGVADALFCGLIAAVVWKTPGINWARYDFALRAFPAAAIVVVMALMFAGPKAQGVYFVFTAFLVAVAGACILLAIMRNAPEAKRLHSPFLCLFGTASYSIYLSHLMVLGLLHGLILGKIPDAASTVQNAISLLAIAITVAVSWVVTRWVEEPVTAYGRSWAWSANARPALPDGTRPEGVPAQA